MCDVRGRDISMIFQNPRAALNPIRRIGQHIEDVLRQHVQAGSFNIGGNAIVALRQVRIANPEERYDAYPFQLSGGMCQRVVIALALPCRPKLLNADEPTTGLEATTQNAVVEMIVELTRKRGMSTILITHDLSLAAAYCDRIVVMEKGRVVETAASADIFKHSVHAYTRKLMRATPRPGIGLRDLLPEDFAAKPIKHGELGAPLLTVAGLVKEYTRKPSSFFARFRKSAHDLPSVPIRAVDGLNFEIRRGESLGLVGESGCGKATTSMMLMRLLDQTAGTIIFDGQDIGAIPTSAFAQLALRPRIQMVFQDPADSLNPHYTAARAIADPLMRFCGAMTASALRARCEELAAMVGLPMDLLDRFPHQLSGGQKARVGIARAIALKPDLVVLDELTAALDVSVQALVLKLLADLKASLGMSYLFVSHDLHVVRLICDQVIVMRSGRIVEQGLATDVLDHPQADYTRELIAALPRAPLWD